MGIVVARLVAQVEIMQFVGAPACYRLPMMYL
jgi:hypothetical protein